MPVRERKFYIKKHNEYQSEVNKQRRSEPNRGDMRRRQNTEEAYTKTVLKQVMG